MNIITTLIQLIFQILSFVIIADALLSFLVPYDNKIRQLLDRIVTPMINPIRRIVPPVNNLDFSPVILLILLQVVESILLRLV